MSTNNDGPADGLAPDLVQAAPLPLRKPRSRLTAVSTVYHQAAGSNPVALSMKFVRLLETEEQVYRRVSRVGEEWQLVDFGWLSGQEVSQLVVTNDEGTRQRVVPTEEEVEATRRKVLEVGVISEATGMDGGPRMSPFPFTRIMPGEFLCLTPVEGQTYVIRSREGTSHFTLVACPG